MNPEIQKMKPETPQMKPDVPKMKPEMIQHASQRLALGAETDFGDVGAIWRPLLGDDIR